MLPKFEAWIPWKWMRQRRRGGRCRGQNSRLGFRGSGCDKGGVEGDAGKIRVGRNWSLPANEANRGRQQNLWAQVLHTMQGIEWNEQLLEGTWTIAAHENGQIQTYKADPNVTSSYEKRDV